VTIAVYYVQNDQDYCVIGNPGGHEIAFINLTEGIVLKTIKMREDN